MKVSSKKDSEYTSLREEYLILENRIHDIWKWGLISIIAILSSIIFYFFEMTKDDGFHKNIKNIVLDNEILILPFLVLIPSAITVFLALMISNIKSVIKRLTGYLTVFHDLNNTDSNKFGWHFWNRIEKFDTNKTWFQAQGDIMIYILLLFFYTLILIGLYNTIKPISYCTLIICIIVIVVAGILTARFERNANESEQKWNYVWTSIKNLNPNEIEYRLNKIMLKINHDK